MSASTLADTILPIGLTEADTDPAIRDPRAVSSVDRSAVDTIIAEWPARPRLGANVMIAKYGAPQEVTSEKLVWHNQGPYKRITVTARKNSHDFPRPHMDFFGFITPTLFGLLPHGYSMFDNPLYLILGVAGSVAVWFLAANDDSLGHEINDVHRA